MLVETSPAFEEVDLLSNQIIADTTSTYFTRTTSIITEHQLVIYNYKNRTHGNDNESIFNIIPSFTICSKRLILDGNL